MIDILGELSTEEFDIQVGPIGPAPALRQRLRSMPQVQAVIKALSEGKLTELDVSNHVGGLCKDFRTGERFAHDLALSAMAVAMEDWEADFAEGSLRILTSIMSLTFHMGAFLRLPFSYHLCTIPLNHTYHLLGPGHLHDEAYRLYTTF